MKNYNFFNLGWIGILFLSLIVASVSFPSPALSREEWVTCNKCGGQGQVYCGRCNGAGQERCYYCNKTGQIWVNQVLEMCQNCNGTGTVLCGRCNGQAYETCSLCNGQGGKYWRFPD